MLWTTSASMKMILYLSDVMSGNVTMRFLWISGHFQKWPRIIPVRWRYDEKRAD